MATIRADVDGVVTAYDAAGVAVVLAPGDTVPEGVEVGDHALDDTTEATAKKAATKRSTSVDTK